jgi:integrase
MAVIDLGNGKFRVRVYNPHLGGKQYQKVVKGKRAADAHEAEMKVKFARGQVLDPNAGKITFGRYADEALEARRLTPSTRANYLRLLERIAPIWGHRPLRSLKHSDAIALTTALRAESDGGSTRNALVLARSICRQALADGYIDRNPFASLRMTTARVPRTQAEATWPEIRAASEGHSKGAAQIVLMSGSGMRRGEVAGLELPSIDWLRKTITVSQQLCYLSDLAASKIGAAHGGFFLAEAKTDAGQDRTIPVPQFVLDALAAYLARHPAVERTLPWLRPDAEPSRTTSLVFGLATLDTITSSVTDRAARVGATWSPHDLRHKYNSTLEQGGIPLRTVQEVMGHAPKGASGIYSHVQPHTLEMIRPLLESWWFGAVEGHENDIESVN